MKKIIMALALCAAASCTNQGDKASESAARFLNAFISNDFETAAECCTEEFRSDFSATIENYRNLDESIKDLFQKECAKYRAEITSVERVNKSDTFLVNYNIVRATPDSSALFSSTAIRSTLVIAGGKVDKLNR